jgi:streptogramin lyase
VYVRRVPAGGDSSACAPRRVRTPLRWARVVLLAAACALVFGAQEAAGDPVGQITKVANGGGSPSAPGPDGNMWFISGTSIGRITPTGQVSDFPVGLRAQAIAAGPDGNVWFTEASGNKIGRLTASGQVAEFSAGLNPGSSPYWIAPGADGNLWFTDVGAIGRITPWGSISEFSGGLSSSALPYGIAPGPDGNVWFTDRATKAIGRITPSGQITEFTAGLSAFSDPTRIAPGSDGNVWFTDNGAIGRITPSGQITEFSAGLSSGSTPYAIAPGSDGNVWFTENGAIGRVTPSGSITEFPGVGTVTIAPASDGNLWFPEFFPKAPPVMARIGTGAPAAVQAGPSLSGAGQPGSSESCQGVQWGSWSGGGPWLTLYPFDGYRWLRDGSPIAGQTGQSYTPTGGDFGHRLACQVTVTYPLPFLVSASAMSSTITVGIPEVSAFRVSPRTFALSGRLVGRRCAAVTKGNRKRPACTRALSLGVRYSLSIPARVTFTIARPLPGRLVGGRCNAPTRANQGHRRCTRLLPIRGKRLRTVGAGANSLTFLGPTGRNALGPGTYQVIATPSAGGHTGTRQSVALRIVR